MPTHAARPRVYVVDDDEAVRDSLALQLDAAGYEVRSFASGREFLAASVGLALGCVILDMCMDGLDGLGVQQRLAELRRGFPVVMITGDGNVASAVQALKAGAVDFVEKPFSEETLLDSLRAAEQRLRDVPQRDVQGEVAAARLARLSRREREVLDGLIAGLPNKTIAYDLALSPRTVEVHRARIMDKMQARSLSELVRLAIAAGVTIKA